MKYNERYNYSDSYFNYDNNEFCNMVNSFRKGAKEIIMKVGKILGKCINDIECVLYDRSGVELGYYGSISKMSVIEKELKVIDYEIGDQAILIRTKVKGEDV